jgi:hypothetical protein
MLAAPLKSQAVVVSLEMQDLLAQYIAGSSISEI